MNMQRLPNSFAKWIVCVLVVAVYGILTGCPYVAQTIPPDLVKTPWVDLKVSYCVGNGPVVTMKTWRSQDPQVLARLKQALAVRKFEMGGAAGGMTTNVSELTLGNGEHWQMTVFNEIFLGFSQLPIKQWHRSCSVDLVNDAFYKALKAHNRARHW